MIAENSRTDTAMPRADPPSIWPSTCNIRSDTRDFSSMTPINTKSGTAISKGLDMIP